MTKQVYFMRQVGGIGNIKIGYSWVPRRRLESLAAWSPEPLEILVAIDGDGALERRIQERFLDSLSHHEWFRPAPDLLAMIERLRAGVPVEEAIDLPDKASVRSVKRRAWELDPDARLRCTYSHRIGWFERRTKQQFPADLQAIYKRWYFGDSVADKPSVDELARFDAVLGPRAVDRRKVANDDFRRVPVTGTVS